MLSVRKIAAAVVACVMLAPVAYAQTSDTPPSASDTTTTNAPDTGNNQQISSGEVKQELQEAIAAVNTYSAQERDKAVTAAKEAMAKLDVEIAQQQEQLRDNWAQMSAAAKQQASEKIAQLQTARNNLSEKYGALQVGAQNAWDQLKTGFTSAYEEVVKAWEASDESDSPQQPSQSDSSSTTSQ
ncbi:hypothetical protein [Roseibium sp. RKSG952]|uniref:hypothetical protein n=1 Tax=Roseibium sp. RKSG952 TaxID=2529384 RepID=UPI0012BBC17A|nr:hypothetical protein [Roseibium sp. RKSG952]MTI00081.1 hypothetical protein [Roseibium sp. RKSG952]